MMTMRLSEPSVSARLCALPALSMKELWSLWDGYFPRRPPHNNRAYVEGRIAYRMQAAALGDGAGEGSGDASRVRAQMIRLGEAQSKFKTQRGIQVLVVPGTVLTREYDEREHRVTAQADATFEYEGRIYKSLSAVARHITGSQWSGPVFFGVVQPAAQRKSALKRAVKREPK